MAIQVGDKVRIKFDSPPDEWGVVEEIDRSSHYNQFVIRYTDGTSKKYAVDRLEVITDTSVLPEQYR